MDFKMIPTSDLSVTKKFSLREKNVSSLCRLVDSIRMYGLQVPLLVRSQENGYVVIDGKLRLLAWKHIGKAPTIPCIVIDSKIGKMDEWDFIKDVEPFKEEENTEEIRELYISVAVNMVRSKVDYPYLKKIVRFLYEDLHLGYGTIAQRIGYSKAGVQKMISRIKKSQKCQNNPSNPLGHTLRRLRTELRKLEENIPPTEDQAEDVKDAIQRVNAYVDSLLNAL